MARKRRVSCGDATERNGLVGYCSGMVQKRRESQRNCGVVNSGVRATQGEVPHRHGIVKRGNCVVSLRLCNELQRNRCVQN